MKAGDPKAKLPEKISAEEFICMLKDGTLVSRNPRRAQFDLLLDNRITESREIINPRPSIEVQKQLALTEQPESAWEPESEGELHFLWMIKELQKAGYIRSYICQPPPFILSEQEFFLIRKPMKRVPDKMIDRELLDGHIYTADFKIFWTEAAHGLFFCPLTPMEMEYPNAPFIAHYDTNEGFYSVVECKPDYDQNNMTRLFRINQKWVYSLFRTYVNLVKTPSFFKHTFCPQRYLYTDKSGKPRKIDFKVRTLAEYLKSVKA